MGEGEDFYLHALSCAAQLSRGGFMDLFLF